MAEYLKRRGVTDCEGGCHAFAHISPNIEPEETGLKTDAGGGGGDARGGSGDGRGDVNGSGNADDAGDAAVTSSGATFLEQLSNSYTETTLTEHLETARKYLVKGERWEALAPIYRLVIPVYEKRRDFRRLCAAYDNLHQVRDGKKDRIRAENSENRNLMT